MVITSGESEETLVEAFTYLKAVLPPEAFFGRGESGPELFLTDDCAAERAALKAVWPSCYAFFTICKHGGVGFGRKSKA